VVLEVMLVPLVTQVIPGGLVTLALLVQEGLGVMEDLELPVTQVMPAVLGIKETPVLQVLAGVVVLVPIQVISILVVVYLVVLPLMGKFIILVGYLVEPVEVGPVLVMVVLVVLVVLVGQVGQGLLLLLAPVILT
jgi:hypothetical protein